MNNKNELLPCPFCGGGLEELITCDAPNHFCMDWRAGAICGQCEIEISTGVYSRGIDIETVKIMNNKHINLRPEDEGR